MISQKNSTEPIEGIRENAIEVKDNDNNGFLSPGDFVVFYAVGPTRWAWDATTKKFVHTKKTLFTSIINKCER